MEAASGVAKYGGIETCLSGWRNIGSNSYTANIAQQQLNLPTLSEEVEFNYITSGN